MFGASGLRAVFEVATPEEVHIRLTFALGSPTRRSGLDFFFFGYFVVSLARTDNANGNFTAEYNLKTEDQIVFYSRRKNKQPSDIPTS